MSAIDPRHNDPEYFEFEQWITVMDEGTCKVCAYLDGSILPAGSGPQPPIHPKCRCKRVHHHWAWAPIAPRDVRGVRIRRP